MEVYYLDLGWALTGACPGPLFAHIWCWILCNISSNSKRHLQVLGLMVILKKSYRIKIIFQTIENKRPRKTRPFILYNYTCLYFLIHSKLFLWSTIQPLFSIFFINRLITSLELFKSVAISWWVSLMEGPNLSTCFFK